MRHRHGKGIREIAHETGISRNTVRCHLRNEKAVRYKPRPVRLAKFDPFRGFVIQRMRAAPERIPTNALLMELGERGYRVGYTMVKRFVALLVGGREARRTMKHSLP
jgi:transposase